VGFHNFVGFTNSHFVNWNCQGIQRWPLLANNADTLSWFSEQYQSNDTNRSSKIASNLPISGIDSW